MNIAAPASCDFYRASLQGERLDREISLSNYHCEAALLASWGLDWLPLKTLDLPEVISWFRSVRTGPSQVAKNPMEKVLFALMHMAKSDMSVMTVIWLFYAFESLLQTRAGENFSSMVRRLSLLLETDKHNSKLIRDGMRELYDLRSAIVHGGFELSHPSHNEILDKRLDDNFAKIQKATDFGYALLLAAVQKSIENNWQYPRFVETLVGGPPTKPIPNL
jgi:hypothetical protein